MNGDPATRGPTVQYMLSHALRRYRDEVCLRWEGGTATFGETSARTIPLGEWLHANSGPLSHVGILLPNSRAYIEAILACALSGCVRVPLSTRDPIVVSRQKLEDSGTQLVITSSELAEELRAAGVDVSLLVVGGRRSEAWTLFDDVVDGMSTQTPEPSNRAEVSDRYRLSFTGGTTGSPKAVVQTHIQERAMIRNLLLEASSPMPSTCFVAATPLSHAAGAFVLPTVLAGGSVSWLDSFDAERLVRPAWLSKDPRVELETFVVPTVLGDVAQAAKGGNSFRTVIYGGAPCPDQTVDEAVSTFGGSLVQVYGQAEAPVTVCIATGGDHLAGRVNGGWVGWPFQFVRVSLDGQGDTGELIVHGEHLMSEYLGKSDETRRKFTSDGGVRTEDLARIGEAGDVTIVGRARDVIISGGFNVYPQEVQRRLTEASGLQLTVFGIPHPRWGDAVVAAVEVPDSERATAVARLEQAATDALADYERPKQYFTIESLPLTAVGKVATGQLEERFGEHFSAGGRSR